MNHPPETGLLAEPFENTQLNVQVRLMDDRPAHFFRLFTEVIECWNYRT